MIAATIPSIRSVLFFLFGRLRAVMPARTRAHRFHFCYLDNSVPCVACGAEMMLATEFEIDGCRFSTLEDFYDEIERVLIPGVQWGRNLDALNDILRGGFGTPEDGFVLRWKNSSLSQQRLGYVETVRRLEKRLRQCHPAHRESAERDLRAARHQIGPTVFDWLIEIIRDHGSQGRQADDRVELILE